jgi:glutamyl-tRNA synthetase
MHVGGVRTALFAWLVARQSSGQFILRIEDTDKAREVAGSEQHIIDSLKWLGLEWDEGPDKGGPFAPYRQSERLEIYKRWAQKLMDKDRAYADPYSVEQVQTFRDEAHKAKKPFLYRDHRPDNPPVWDGKLPLRFKSKPKAYEWHDEVLGELRTGPEVVDDFILIKSDGYPTYNFSHIIDDAEMEMTYVIRGQEFVASTPNYLNLYEALDITAPKLATPPQVLGPGGTKKLGKRDGAKDILDYKKEGYLPEALINFMASLGWNDGSEQEIFSVEELIKKFDLSRVHKSGAHFDEQRLLWMNGHYIRELPIDKLYELSKDFWPPAASDQPEQYKKQILGLIQERLKYLAEIPGLSSFFFEDLPIDLSLIDDNKQLKSFSHIELKGLLQQASVVLEQNDFSLDSLSKSLNHLLETTAQKPGVLFSLIRIATTWVPASPGLAETLSLLGKDKSLQRLKQATAALAE